MWGAGCSGAGGLVIWGRSPHLLRPGTSFSPPTPQIPDAQLPLTNQPPFLLPHLNLLPWLPVPVNAGKTACGMWVCQDQGGGWLVHREGLSVWGWGKGLVAQCQWGRQNAALGLGSADWFSQPHSCSGNYIKVQLDWSCWT